ncbi:MAG: hypothetical protein J7K40_06225 [candidate division Zixibacteria bacterium]|nr:hypothetical protein [candidate division Zixibacteria bacterium]
MIEFIVVIVIVGAAVYFTGKTLIAQTKGCNFCAYCKVGKNFDKLIKLSSEESPKK